MKPRVLLINAPTVNTQKLCATTDNYFPLGLLYLAAVLKKNGIDAAISDINNKYYSKHLNEEVLARFLDNEFCKYMNDYKPDIVGIGCTFSGAFRSLKMIAKKIKGVYPKMPIVIGGIHPTVFAKEILSEYSYIDYVVIGEGENTFFKLARSIIADDRSPASIEGIGFRNGEEIKINPKTEFENDLDALPFVDYSMLNVAEYKMDTSGWYSPGKMTIGQPFSIISSRSCPNRCNFCSMRLVHGPRFRFRSSGNVLDEMEDLYGKHNARYFQFMDDNMTFDKKRTLEICRGIKRRKMDIQFDTPNGVAINRLDEEIVDAMVDAGMVRISLGIESGSEYIRNRIMRKGLGTKKIYEVVETCAKHKELFIKGFFIIGMPQETPETLQETYDMIKDLPFDRISVNFIAPYPGTDLFDYCIRRGMLGCKLEEYLDVEVFQDSDDRPHFKPHNLTMEELVRFRKKCNDCMEERRGASGLPDNYPMRYGGRDFLAKR